MSKFKKYAPEGFPEKLNQLIIKSGLNGKEIAERVGVERKAIISYRYGQTTPQLATLIKMCKLFDVSADWLLGLEDNDDKRRKD